MSTYFKLGRLGFSISGQDAVVPHICSEFAPVSSENHSDVQLQFTFVDKLPPPAEFAQCSPVMSREDSFRVSGGGFTYEVSKDRGAINIHLESDTNGPGSGTAGHFCPGWLRRARNWNYLLPIEDKAKGFMYGVFDYLSQVAQLPIGQSHLHCSSVAKGETGIAFVGWGGVGKTTAVLKLICEDKWTYLSDDLGVIDESGRLWRSPKRMQIYAYNVAGQRELYDRLMLGRSTIDRLSWHWKRYRWGNKGVRRRVAAEDLFGPSLVGSSAQLTLGMFFERRYSSGFRASRLTTEDFANRSAAVLMHELQPFGHYSAAVHSAGCCETLPSCSVFHEHTRNVLARAFAGTESLLIAIPQDAGPDELADYLRGILR